MNPKTNNKPSAEEIAASTDFLGQAAEIGDNAVQQEEIKNETAIAIPDYAFDAIEQIEELAESELQELTSALLKLNNGEQWAGILTRETETIDNDGKPYEAAVMFDKNRCKILCADAVLVSTQQSIFAKLPTAQTVVVKIICKGERKSAKGSYRDLKIYILK